MGTSVSRPFHKRRTGGGKIIAGRTGKVYTLPAFPEKGDTWLDFVQREMDKHGITAEERVYDPEEDRHLDNPVTVNVGHVLKLHHLAGGKMTARGSAGYDLNRQPMKGGSGGGKAQRLSGLVMNVRPFGPVTLPQPGQCPKRVVLLIVGALAL